MKPSVWADSWMIGDPAEALTQSCINDLVAPFIEQIMKPG